MGVSGQQALNFSMNSQVVAVDQDQIVLNLNELDKIFAVYHSNQDNASFLKTKGILREKNSMLPTLKEKAIFFTCQDDTVYESVLDDLRQEHTKMTKENKKWMFKKGVQAKK